MLKSAISNAQILALNGADNLSPVQLFYYMDSQYG